MIYNQQCERREGEPADARLVWCMGMLHVHGFLTDAEKRKVYKRICKWVKDAQDKAPIPETTK